LEELREEMKSKFEYFVTDNQNLNKDHAALSQQNCWKELHNFKNGDQHVLEVWNCFPDFFYP